MADIIVGQRVKIRPKVGQEQEGVVYTQDALTNTITIKQDIPNTKTHSTILVFNRAYVDIDAVPGAPVVDEHMTLPAIRYLDSERKGQESFHPSVVQSASCRLQTDGRFNDAQTFTNPRKNMLRGITKIALILRDDSRDNIPGTRMTNPMNDFRFG